MLTDLSIRELPFMLQHLSSGIEDGSCRLLIHKLLVQACTF